jgi:HD-like signal output (HDOD) protein
MPSIDQLVRDVADLAPLPTAYVRIRDMVGDPKASARDVAQMISNDPGLTSRLLRIANSAYLGLISKVDTVPRAVQVLGLNQVHDLALATSAIGTLCRVTNPVIDIFDFWRRSIYCAVFAQVTAAFIGVRPAERLFVSGLLHDAGHLVLAAREPALYKDLLQQSIATQRPLAECERAVLGFDYAALGAALLAHWLLPDAIWLPVQRHTEPNATQGDEHASAACIVHVAAVVSRATLWKSEADEPVPEFDTLAFSALGLDDGQIQTLMTSADEKVVHAYELLMPRRARAA